MEKNYWKEELVQEEWTRGIKPWLTKATQPTNKQYHQQVADNIPKSFDHPTHKPHDGEPKPSQNPSKFYSPILKLV